MVLMGSIQEYGLGFIKFYALEFSSVVFTRVDICCFFIVADKDKDKMRHFGLTG